MPKNHRIEARVGEDVKKALMKKAESYGSLARFLEEIAKKDIILIDKQVSKLLKDDVRQNAVRGL